MKATNHMPSEKSALQLYHRLHQFALEQGAHSKLPRVSELCEQFETSRVTLSEALDLLEKQQVIYRQHSKGIFVSPKAYCKNIAVLIDASRFAGCDASSFWGALLYLLSQEAQRRVVKHNEKYDFHLVMRMPGDEAIFSRDMLDTIRSKRMYGVLSIGLSKHEYMKILQHEIPCVSFAGYGEYMVEQDSKEFLALGVKNLVDAGCKRIGLWMHAAWSYGELREINDKQFHDLLSQKTCHYYPDLVKDISGYVPHEHAEKYSAQEQGYRMAIDVFGEASATERPDGIIIPEDRMMEGVLAAFHYLGIHPGKDVKIATHANTDSLYGLNNIPGVFIIESNPADIVQTMFHILECLITGEKLPPATWYIQPVLRGQVG